MTFPVDPRPVLLLEGGQKLKIPQNVWFVGTANQDETTKGFAPKTYDRAHVLEFPNRPEEFEIAAYSPRRPVSCSALRDAFNRAEKAHSRQAAAANAYLRTELRDLLADLFDIGWGSRFEKQLGRYVPVVVAAGGTVGEATDHMLASRLISKLKDRHDIQAGEVQVLEQRVLSTWSKLDKKRGPTRSITLLRKERRRLGDAIEAAD